MLSAVFTRHFRNDLLPPKAHLTWESITESLSDHLRLKRPGVESYNVLQRLTYLGVLFVLFPLLIWTGFAMSPAIVSVVPGLVTVLGGQESARSLHFFVADLLVLFFAVHIAMVSLSGFWTRVRAMLTGHAAAREGERT